VPTDESVAAEITASNETTVRPGTTTTTTVVVATSVDTVLNETVKNDVISLNIEVANASKLGEPPSFGLYFGIFKTF
jgi:hypothetical protein